MMIGGQDWQHHFKKPQRAFGNIWGGSQRELHQLDFTPDLLVRLNGQFGPEAIPTIQANTAARMNPDVGSWLPDEIPTLDINWPDMSVPALGRKFWVDLANYSKWASTREFVFACTGGMGRTGTSLAILAGLRLDFGGLKEDPVTYIRHVYDFMAVETLSQVKYVEEMTGISCAAAYPMVPTFQGYGVRKKRVRKPSTPATGNQPLPPQKQP